MVLVLGSPWQWLYLSSDPLGRIFEVLMQFIELLHRLKFFHNTNFLIQDAKLWNSYLPAFNNLSNSHINHSKIFRPKFSRFFFLCLFRFLFFRLLFFLLFFLLPFLILSFRLSLFFLLLWFFFNWLSNFFILFFRCLLFSFNFSSFFSFFWFSSCMAFSASICFKLVDQMVDFLGCIFEVLHLLIGDYKN